MASTYMYWLLRYVPNAVRGEAVNVGVLVGRDGGDWSLRRVHSYARANRLGGDARRIEPWLAALEREVRDWMSPELAVFRGDRPEGLSSSRIHRMQLRLNNSIQIAEPAIVQGETAIETADFLYDFLVQEEPKAHRSTTRRRLVGQLREQYEQLAELHVGGTLQAKPLARVGRQRGRFDFAVVDDEVNQLSQVWTFDLADMDRLEQEIHAWSYLVTRLRNDGGELGLKRGQSALAPLRIAEDVAIATVVQPPTPNGVHRAERQEVYLAAQEAWNDLAVEVVQSTEMDRVAREALALTA
ncbi:DUF3037 domain-containing protein [Agromyces mariniharenae]|uniref:DUF3037 domain-containing protein n=1 Tax=Agromyces mariniharenae TaxID=2604423 RepID=A0A5S4V8M9_9MICO|nr:DUF3037 domain-containing protein [Agromyces mariniharenae]TYL50475.1 DUF3037 domain-containing protein [Agromyces mariniharenae]